MDYGISLAKKNMIITHKILNIFPLNLCKRYNIKSLVKGYCGALTQSFFISFIGIDFKFVFETFS